MTEDFPTFETFICSEDIYTEFMKKLKKLPKKIRNILGVKIMVEKVMPPNSGLFLDHHGYPVAIYKDGKIAFHKK